MKNENFFKINWLNIISNKEFQIFLNRNILRELSMLSKLVRIKLSPKIFDFIKLDKKYDYSIGALTSDYNVGEFTALINIINSGDVVFKNSFCIDKVISNNFYGLKRLKNLY
jgi:hypothetical protein